MNLATVGCPDPAVWAHDTSLFHFTRPGEPCTLPTQLFTVLLALATPVHFAVVAGNAYQAKVSRSRARLIAITSCITSLLGYLVHVALYVQGGMYEAGAAILGMHIVGIIAVSFQSLQILLHPVISINSKSRNEFARKVARYSIFFFAVSACVVASVFIAMAVFSREQDTYNTLVVSILLYGISISVVTPVLIFYASGRLLSELTMVRTKSGASKSALAKLEMLAFRIGKMRRVALVYPMVAAFGLLPMVVMYFALTYVAYQWVFYTFFITIKWVAALNYLLFLSKTGGKRTSSNSLSKDSSREEERKSRKTTKSRGAAGAAGTAAAAGHQDGDDELDGAFSSRDSKEISKLSKDDEFGSANGSANLAVRASKDDSKDEVESVGGGSRIDDAAVMAYVP